VSKPGPKAVIFDIGRVLFQWEPERLYIDLIPDPAERARFLAEVVTMEWHAQHDLGVPFAETSAALTARFPEQGTLITAWGERFNETLPGAVPGVIEIVEELDAAGVPLFALTNFSHEFFPPFRATQTAVFDRFRAILVSGEEQLIKPDPAIYRLALERFGLAAEDAAFFDDMPANVDAATALGIHARRFTDAETLRRDLIGLGVLA